MRTIATIVTILVLSFYCDHVQAYQKLYEVTNGQLSLAGGPAESIQGTLTIKSPLVFVEGHEGDIIYPEPPMYKYSDINLTSSSHSMFLSNVDYVPSVVYGTLMDFGYLDQNENQLEMSTVVLEREIIEEWFVGNRKYWKFTDRTLVPVNSSDQNDNALAYDENLEYYPSNIHFTYDYRVSIHVVYENSPNAGGIVFPVYGHETESDVSIGILAFDAIPVPIPGAAWLLGSGMLGMIGLRKWLKP